MYQRYIFSFLPLCDRSPASSELLASVQLVMLSYVCVVFLDSRSLAPSADQVISAGTLNFDET